MGESGSGKTTLLNILASLDKPTGGEVFLNNKNITLIREKELSAFKRDYYKSAVDSCRRADGALDSKASVGLLKVFREINDDGQTILMVTHSLNAASHANRVLFIKDGEVFHQLYRGNLTNEQLYVKISDTLTVLSKN